MNAIRIIAVIAVACIALSPAARADSVQYLILGPDGVADCTFSGAPGVYTVYAATLNLSAPARALEVSAPQLCDGAGITWNYPVSGDPNALLTVDFGECISGSVELFTAEFDVNGCCPALLHGPVTAGSAQDSPPVLIGCDGERRYLIPPCSAVSPSLLTPADGATGVSPTPFMSWDYPLGDYCQEGIGLYLFTINYGTDPTALDQQAVPMDATEWTLPMLEPLTQYFWRVKVWDDFAYYSGTMINFSETHSFTTAGPVPVENTTWGAVKSLYQ
jgi:hypothetical protein